MNKLPPELVQKTIGELEFRDLKSARLVNKEYAALAKSFLFSTIQFLGPGHRTEPKRTVEFSKLPKAVEDVLPMVGDASKLIFAPAFFQEGMRLSQVHTSLLFQLLTIVLRRLEWLSGYDQQPIRGARGWGRLHI